MSQTSETAGKREWIGLAVLALPALLVSFDVFVLVLALPHLSADLGAGSTQQLWIMDIYGFMVAGFLVSMGTLGDRIGRRRLLLIGGAGFVAASVLSAYATTPEMLIAARALLGFAGATLAPSTLALISNMFRDPKQRSLAIGVWAACFTVGAIVGPIVGGLMLEHFWWGSVFLLGVPPLALLLVLGPILLPEYRDTAAGRLDLVSIVLSLGAVLPMMHGLKDLAKDGFAPVPLTWLLAGIVVGMVFLRRQRRIADPIVDITLFANRAFSAALGSMMLTTMLGGSVMMIFAQHLQQVQLLSPLGAAFALLPGMAATTVSFLLSPLLARRVARATLIAGGMLLSAAGMVVFAVADPAASPLVMTFGFVLMALGGGPLITLGTDLVVGSAPPEKAGSAAALSETSHEFGFALGIGMLGSLAAVVYRSQLDHKAAPGLPAAALRAARENLAGATTAAEGLSARAGAALLDAARDAFTSGLQVVAAVGAAAFVGVAILVLVMLRDTEPSRHGATPDDDPAPDADLNLTGAV